MGKCEDCNTDIQDRYKVCIDCLKKRQQANKSEDSKEVVKALGAINNNLYCIRRQNEVLLRETYGLAIVWSKTKKDFVEKKVKKQVN